MAELFRTCLLLPGHGAAFTTAGQYHYPLTDLSTQMERTRSTANLYADGASLWAVRGVTYAGTALYYCGLEALQMRTNNFQQVATGTPVFWFRNGGQAFGVWPDLVAAAGITAFGYCLTTPRGRRPPPGREGDAYPSGPAPERDRSDVQ